MYKETELNDAINVILLFDSQVDPSTCRISMALFRELGNCQHACIDIPSYTNIIRESRAINIVVDSSITGDNRIVVNPLLFGTDTDLPTINTATIRQLENTIEMLEAVKILLTANLYDRLHNLGKKEEILEFFRIKYNLQEDKSILNKNESLDIVHCKIIDCYPFNHGFVNFKKTKFIFKKDIDNILGLKTHFPILKQEMPLQSVELPIKCLPIPITNDLIKPSPPKDGDLTICGFVSPDILLALGIASGDSVVIMSEHNKKAIKLYTLLSPSSLPSQILYLHPRIKASFTGIPKIKILNNSLTLYDIHVTPIASVVSLAKVGSLLQVQKVHQSNIIYNLQVYFKSAKRILQKGDMIPISFDSNVSSNTTESNIIYQQSKKKDSLVWFIVDQIKYDKTNIISQYSDIEIAAVDPTQTKLLTSNIVSRQNMTKTECDLGRFFNLGKNIEFNNNIFPYVPILKNRLTVLNSCSSKGIAHGAFIIIHSHTANVGKRQVVKSIALDLGIELIEIDCMYLNATQGTLDDVNKIIATIEARLEAILPYVHSSIVLLSHLDVILMRKDANHDIIGARLAEILDIELTHLIEEYSSNYPGTIFISTMNDYDKLPSNLLSIRTFELEIPVPSASQRTSIFNWYLFFENLNEVSYNNIVIRTTRDIDIAKFSQMSAGLTPLDIKLIVETSKSKCLRSYLKNKNSRFVKGVPNICYMSNEVIIGMIDDARAEYSRSIGAPTIPNVLWDDVGGVEHAKKEILDTIDMPLKHPELFSSGMKKRSGLLFYGPPGTGKTLIAKAIATNFSLNFFSVKGPELLNMYIGESEANVRRVFQKARDAKPCVIFFDELDSVAPKRGNQGDSGGVMDRIVSQLLAELDGMNSNGDGIFVIGATNRPDLLDEALLRPGRFDTLLYLGLADTDEKQINILQALTRKFNLADDLKLEDIAKMCPYNYTGADFYALCSDAMLAAMTRVAEETDQKLKDYNKNNDKQLSIKQWFDQICTPEDITIKVSNTDFEKSLKQLVPSISEGELQHYLNIKHKFENSKENKP
ncbi:hypothetical protein TBLA_0I00550 [Henningerozyma blattae CBS 6284]|uniref:Peroxisomal ATPase PEX6 n=1 Tax=Henningerozyma blattae (strain ATCC 34711 / CBS 6284 / DSM 70876 / NBRC 10599 / NRRL Y-10934 / UCD 77-7) TaxID=1071380 RepID=I2H8L3_HENB6|nr:hypothetical protein TBLA_0I00550 [Tetrapisispora blattae CBS 6284]CCH62715.1 hypothetical protein TBLA_0I00550 [Tetrapisispora blattae CBS 6284]